MHDVSCDESCLFRKEKGTRIGDHITLRAFSEWMDRVEIFSDSRRIRLIVSPLAQHWRPRSRWADGVHADAELCVVERHRFSQGVHSTLRGRVRGVRRLPDDTYET